MDALLTVAVVVLVILAAVIVVQRVKYKNLVLQTEQSKKDLIEKEAILQKEAMIKAKEALHIEREQLNEDERERRREFAAIENKLSKREDILEDKIQEVSDKELELDKLSVDRKRRFSCRNSAETDRRTGKNCRYVYRRSQKNAS